MVKKKESPPSGKDTETVKAAAGKEKPGRPRAAATENLGADSPLYVNSVEKAMKVLMAFDGQQRQLSLSQIAALTGFDLSTTQRFTYTLMTLGYLTKDEAIRKYALAPQVLNFAYHYLSSSDLVRRATPYLQQLSQETEETTNLTILDGTDIVFVQRIVSRNVLNPNVVTGTRLPAFCTASGLAIMSAMDSHEVDDILARTELRMFTPFTLIDKDKIKARLGLFREQGYAHIREEYFLGDISTAAVVTDFRLGRPVGAVNMAVTTARWGGDADERRHAGLVMSAARAVSVEGR